MFSDLLKRMTIWHVAAVAIVLRLIVVGVSSSDIHTIEDFRIASNLAEGHGFSFDLLLGPTAYKAPAYPAVLAGIMLIVGVSATPIVTAVLQAIIGGLSVVLMHRIVRLLTTSETAALGSAALLALHPSYIVYPRVLEPTLWTVALSMIVFLALQQRRWVRAGIVSGLVVLFQPVAIGVLLVLAAIHLRRSWGPVITIVCCAALVILPWTLRNAIVFGRFIPVKSPVWMNVYEGFLPENSGLQEPFVHDSIITSIDTLRKNVNDVDMESHYRTIATKAISDNPLGYGQRVLNAALRLWSFPPRYDMKITIGFFIIRLLPVVFLMILTLITFRTAWNLYPVLMRSILVVFLVVTATYALTHAANIRFKLDIEWLQILVIALGATGLHSFGQRLSNKPWMHQVIDRKHLR